MITFYKSNLTNLFPEVDLKRINIISGRNGAGKTLLLNSIYSNIDSEDKEFIEHAQALELNEWAQKEFEEIIKIHQSQIVEFLKISMPDLIELELDQYGQIFIYTEKNALNINNCGRSMNTLLQIVLMLFSCKNGYLFVEDIELSLHWSVMPEFWKLVFRYSEELNIQVFATTQSYEMVKSALFAMSAFKEKDLLQYMRIELDLQGNRFVKTYTISDLKSAIKQNFEIR